jgi:hypothetical protein
MPLNWNEWEGLKVKRATSFGDLEFMKQNDIPDHIHLITNKGTITIEAMRPDEQDEDSIDATGRPWLRIRKE